MPIAKLTNSAAPAALLVLLAACSDPQPAQAPSAEVKPANPQAVAQPVDPARVESNVALAPGAQPTLPNAVGAAPAVVASASPVAQAIDAAAFGAPAAAVEKAGAANKAMGADERRNLIVRAQVLLDRARFSPGVIDGQQGGNLKLALTAYQKAKNLPATGALDAATWNALTTADSAPAMRDYVLTAEDVAGPFTPKIPPDDYKAMAKQPRLGFTSAKEALAEKFHMDEALLTALNPGVDFTQAGQTIVVAAAGADALDAKVAAIQVDKSLGEVRAYDEAGTLLAVYPATVGSTERPAPSGEWAVRTVAPNPTWTYDPARLTFGKIKGKLTLAAGPNNPVGATWIDLTKDTYGIHGAPDPRLVNKRASHGCVRLTNWDVRELASAVTKGAKVSFVGVESRAKT